MNQEAGKRGYGGKDLWNRWWFIGHEWKREGVTDDESGDDDVNDVMWDEMSEMQRDWGCESRELTAETRDEPHQSDTC